MTRIRSFPRVSGVCHLLLGIQLGMDGEATKKDLAYSQVLDITGGDDEKLVLRSRLQAGNSRPPA
jgi:hypothetical protein